MTSKRPVCARADSRQPFLEPPHCHDPTAVCLVGSLPSLVMAKISVEAQEAVWDMQESASVAQASYERLQDLLDERLDRLMPQVAPDGFFFSESSWFNYDNQLRAEWDYLFSEAVPDLLHKASQAKPALQPFFHLLLPPNVSDHSISLELWWITLQKSISEWVRQARAVEIPQFDDTVEEFWSGRHESSARESGQRLAADTSTARNEIPLMPSPPPTAIVSTHDGMDTPPTELIEIPPSMCSREAEVSIPPFESRKDSGIGMVLA